MITLETLGVGHLRDARPLALIAAMPVVEGPRRMMFEGRHLHLIPPFIMAEPATALASVARRRHRLFKPGPY